MLQKILLSALAFGILCLGSPVLWGATLDPAQAVVAVVSLDDQGQPRRQGLGVGIGKDGTVLTSASLLTPGGVSVVRTGQGAKYLIQEVLYQDALQDLAVVRVAADQLPGVDLGAAGRVRPAAAVRVGLRQDLQVVLKEAQVESIHPFSPRLTLVKLKPSLAEAEPGAPLFDSRGELVGLVHAFAGGSGAGTGFQVILARDRNLLPRELWTPATRPAPRESKDEREAASQKEKTSGPPSPAPLNSQVSLAATGQDQQKPPAGAGSEAYTAFWQGVQASLDLKWQKAQEQFTIALAAPGGLPEAAFGRGVARYHLGDYEAATRDFLEATRRLSHYALADLWLGKAWERLGNRTLAREAYQRAISQSPDFQEAWFALGVLAYHEGRLDEAQECLERAGDGVEQAAQRFFYLGTIARSRGRLEQAQSSFTEAVQRDAGFFPAYLEGGKNLLDLGRPQEAAHVLTELIRRDPQLPLARYYLTLAYQAAWKTKEAWEQYLALQKLDPTLAARLAPVLERGR